MHILCLIACLGLALLGCISQAAVPHSRVDLTVEYDWFEGAITVPETGEPAVLVKVKDAFAVYGVNLTWEKGSLISKRNNTVAIPCRSDWADGYAQEMLDLLQHTKSDDGNGEKAHIILAGRAVNECNCARCSSDPTPLHPEVECIAGTPAQIFGIAVARYDLPPGANLPANPMQCGALIFLGQEGLDNDYKQMTAIFHELGHLLGFKHCDENFSCPMNALAVKEAVIAHDGPTLPHCPQHILTTYVEPTTGKKVLKCNVPGTNGEMWFSGHTLDPIREVDEHAVR